ncbi:hypothetical protein B484DRAFT_439243, partial [Ochromonadaceae sp. CCMP2298]
TLFDAPTILKMSKQSNKVAAKSVAAKSVGAKSKPPTGLNVGKAAKSVSKNATKGAAKVGAKKGGGAPKAVPKTVHALNLYSNTYTETGVEIHGIATSPAAVAADTRNFLLNTSDSEDGADVEDEGDDGDGVVEVQNVTPGQGVVKITSTKRVSWSREPREDANGMKNEALSLYVAHDFHLGTGNKTKNINKLAGLLNDGVLKDTTLRVNADSLGKVFNRILSDVESTIYTNKNGPGDGNSQDTLVMKNFEVLAVQIITAKEEATEMKIIEKTDKITRDNSMSVVEEKALNHPNGKSS